jgi:TorA maturation chaperone TorD
MDSNITTNVLELLSVRGATYRLLSRLWGAEVDAALYQGLRQTTFPGIPAMPALDDAYRRLEKALQQDEEQALIDLAADYAVLCLGARRSDGADPYGSVHLTEDHIMMQDPWEQMLYVYYELGLQKALATTEPEDHLALELECMAHLSGRAHSSLEEGLEADALNDLGWQLTLLEDHMVKWVPSFVDDVLRLANTEFYRAVALITREYLEMDLAILADLDFVERRALPAIAPIK